MRNLERARTLLTEQVGSDYLDKKARKRELSRIKQKKKKLTKQRDELDRQISMTKNSPRPQQMVADELAILERNRKKLTKKIKKQKKKAKNTKRDLSEFDTRYSISADVEQIVNVDGLFRTPDTRYIDNGLLDLSIHGIGRMLNHANPNFRKIGSIVESIIGNLSLCICDSTMIDHKMIELLNQYIFTQKPVLDVLDPIAIVIYNKFLILSHLNNDAIVYECDRIGKTNKFSTAYRRYCEGKYPFDQFVDFAKFQNRYMSQEQQILFIQYQRVIRAMEDRGMVDCQSGKLKQRIRNGLRDIGIRKNQIGGLIHYTYDKSLDAARKYYSEKDERLAPVFDYISAISRFSPDYAAEMYAMDGF